MLLPSRTSLASQAPPEEHCPSLSKAALPRGALPCPLCPTGNTQKCQCLKVPLTLSTSRTQNSHSHFRANLFFFFSFSVWPLPWVLLLLQAEFVSLVISLFSCSPLIAFSKMKDSDGAFPSEVFSFGEGGSHRQTLPHLG